jgi:ankyrin repeat protein
MQFQNKLLIILIALLSLNGFAQDSDYSDTTVIDTSLFISGDIDYNLIIASDKGYTDVVLDLLNKGADINTSTWEGVTPLMFAVQNQDTAMVQMLVLNGADMDKKPDNGIPVLINAVINNNFYITEYLIRRGADINIGDNKGNTALIYGAAYGHFVISDMLLYYDADLSKKNNSGADALMVASYFGDYDIAFRLIEEGANVNSKDFRGYSAIHYATQNGYTDLIELLTGKGANINTKTLNGYFPVAIAIEYEDLELLKFLIEMGADINERISFAENPLSLANEYKYKSIKNLLLKNNARINLWPAFNQYKIGLNFNWNFDDFMTGIKFGLHDKKYNIDISSAFYLRPWAIRVLEKESEILSYQYWERRMSLIIGLDKKFDIVKFHTGSILGISLIAKELYTFGSYRGSSSKPDNRFIFVPGAGLYWSISYFEINMQYNYTDYDLYDVKSARFDISFIFKFNRMKNNYFPVNIGEF